MKKLLIVLFVASALAGDAKFITLANDPENIDGIFKFPQHSTKLEIQEWETAEVVSSQSSYFDGENFHDGGKPIIQVYRKGNPIPISWWYTYPTDKCIVTGPCSIQMDAVPGSTSSGSPIFKPSFATIKITPGPVGIEKTLLVPPSTNAVTVALESSTNLVAWNSVATFSMTNVPAATFFRMRLTTAP